MDTINMTRARQSECGVIIQQCGEMLRVECHAGNRNLAGNGRGFEQKFGADSEIASAAAQGLTR
jgi:hypothetical protein